MRLSALTGGEEDEPQLTSTDSPLRAYERLSHAQHALVLALDAQPSGARMLDLLDAGLLGLMEVSQAVGASLFVLDEQSRELNFVLVTGAVGADKLRWRKLPAGYGIAGWVAEHAKPIVSNDTSFDSRFCRWFDDELDFKTKAVLAVPIINAAQVLGVVELVNKVDGGLFTNLDVANATVFANLAGQALQDLARRGEQAST